MVVVGPLENFFNQTYSKYKPVCIISSKAYYSTLPKSELAAFPTDTSITYENPLKSRHDICFNYKNLEGVIYGLQKLQVKNIKVALLI